MGRPIAALAPEALAGMELFLGLASSALAEVAARARLSHLAKNAMVFEQGQPADRCHALLSVRVRITQSDQDGAQLVVRFVGPREVFGTVALFTDRAYPAEAVAVTDSIEISWTEAALLELIARHPQIAVNILKCLAPGLGRCKSVCANSPPSGSSAALPMFSCV